MTTLKNGSKYTFTTIAPAILGHSFSDMVLEGSISYRLAAKNNSIDSLAASLIAYLPDGISRDYTSYNFYSFRSENTGAELVIASEWINQNSIQESLDTFLDIRIHGATQKDIAMIKNILGLAGFSTISGLT